MRFRVSLAALGITLLSASAPGQVKTGMINVGDAAISFEITGAASQSSSSTAGRRT